MCALDGSALDASDGLNDELVDNPLQSACSGEAVIALFSVEGNLPVGAGAVRKDGAGVRDFGANVEMGRVVAHQLQQLLNQRGARNHLSTARINETPLQPVPLRPPAV